MQKPAGLYGFGAVSSALAVNTSLFTQVAQPQPLTFQTVETQLLQAPSLTGLRRAPASAPIPGMGANLAEYPLLPIGERCDDVFVGFCAAQGMVGGDTLSNPNLRVQQVGTRVTMECSTPRGRFVGSCGERVYFGGEAGLPQVAPIVKTTATGGKVAYTMAPALAAGMAPSQISSWLAQQGARGGQGQAGAGVPAEQVQPIDSQQTYEDWLRAQPQAQKPAAGGNAAMIAGVGLLALALLRR